jgi:hypothetical protein
VTHLHSLTRLSQAIGLDCDWLRCEAIAGRIPCRNIGQRLVFDLSDVEAAIERRLAQSDLSEECVKCH